MKNLFKKYFMAGLIALLPIAGTLWLLKIIVFGAENFFQSFIPMRFHPQTLLGYNIPGIGIVIATAIILLTGVLTRLYIGNQLLSLGDRLFGRIPFGKGIYAAIKQFLATITGEGKRSFRRVVLVEFPAPGIFALAFVTGDTQGKAREASQEKLINIFLPTTPNPTTGFFLMVPESKLSYLEISVEDAFKLIISGGVVGKFSEINSAER
jgi:uncharacterized membrane protein